MALVETGRADLCHCCQAQQSSKRNQIFLGHRQAHLADLHQQKPQGIVKMQSQRLVHLLHHHILHQKKK